MEGHRKARGSWLGRGVLVCLLIAVIGSSRAAATSYSWVPVFIDPQFTGFDTWPVWTYPSLACPIEGRTWPDLSLAYARPNGMTEDPHRGFDIPVSKLSTFVGAVAPGDITFVDYSMGTVVQTIKDQSGNTYNLKAEYRLLDTNSRYSPGRGSDIPQT